MFTACAILHRPFLITNAAGKPVQYVKRVRCPERTFAIPPRSPPDLFPQVVKGTRRGYNGSVVSSSMLLWMDSNGHILSCQAMRISTELFMEVSPFKRSGLNYLKSNIFGGRNTELISGSLIRILFNSVVPRDVNFKENIDTVLDTSI